MEELKSVKERRRRLGMTQGQLAKSSGVSQSLIAKIESGRLDPSYSKAMAILSALERQQLSGEKKASDIMHRGVEALQSGEKLHAAALQMRKKNISQLPVVDGKRVIGSISEQTIVEQFSSGRKSIAGLLVSEAMGEAFPSALPSTPISAIAALLRHSPAVLVMEKGEIAGIITKADLLKTI